MRLQTSSDKSYKGYFRGLYKAYGLTLERNLQQLRADLIANRYKPEHSTKLYFPKKSGILRPISLLNINDQIVYTALVSIVAEKLFPKVRRSYDKTVFGHLYDGKNSIYLYKRWQDSHSKFNKAINSAFTGGYKCTATFDLTAYYDSIDYKVLCYFLEQLGLQKEFNQFLTTCLEIWTACTPNRIYHGHGIPQGPLPSGLLSEVLLQHFDKSSNIKKIDVKYFRYVDDIRLLAKDESELRKALIELDFISKEIGLFPQSSKINIHAIEDIQEEIKTVSLPPEDFITKEEVDQESVINRIDELTIGNKIQNETRFKYVLALAKPNERLARKLLVLFNRYPHLYQSILKHFSKYSKFSKSISRKILESAKREQFYEEVTANLLSVSLNKIHKDLRSDYKEFCILLYKNKKNINSPNLRSVVFAWLLDGQHIRFSDLSKIYITKEWWLIHNSIDYIDIDLYGAPSYGYLLNLLLKSQSFEVAIKAAYLLSVYNLGVTVPVSEIHSAAQFILKKAGLIGKTIQSKSYISENLEAIIGEPLSKMNWKKFMFEHYADAERLSFLIVGYTKTDANAFINQFDVFNDFLCNCLFKKDSRIGQYKLGNIGGVLNGTSQFALIYPMFFSLCLKVHNLRLESDLSHPIVKTTKKATRRIKFAEIQKLKVEIKNGFEELISKIISI